MAKKTSKGAAIAMPTEDKSWQARIDANTLKDAHEIMADKMRHGAAQAHAAKEMQAMHRVVSAKPTGPLPKAPGLGFAKK